MHGKELSYNNLVDLDAAWQLVSEFAARCSDHQAHESLRLRRAGHAGRELTEGVRVRSGIGIRRRDRLQPRGGRGDRAEIAKTFIEAIAAPGYTPEALAILREEESAVDAGAAGRTLVVKSISGGYLAQTADTHRLDRAERAVRTQRAPTEEEWMALEFAWKVAKHVKSNAIVYARPDRRVGVGAGQMSRVDSVKIGAMKAMLPLPGTVVGVGRILSVSGRRGGGGQAWRDGSDSARRIGARRRGDRGGGPVGAGDGVHRSAAFPALVIEPESPRREGDQEVTNTGSNYFDAAAAGRANRP